MRRFRISGIRKNEARLFLLIFLILGTLIVGSLLVVYFGQFREIRTKLAREQIMDLEIQSELVQSRFKELVSDIRYLSYMDGLYRYFENPNNLADLEADYRAFSRAKTQYGQIRFLNTEGMEIVRINRSSGEPLPVAPEKLQDKSHRYYFIEAVALPRNGLFLSDLDLNIENGKVENPQVPTIRLAAPVYYNGELKGVVVLNYLAASLLEQLRNFGERYLGYLTLLNSEGEYLISRNPGLEWGFMFPERDTQSFSEQFPELWDSISRTESYQSTGSKQIASSAWIRPLGGPLTDAMDYYWIALNRVPGDQLKKAARSLLNRLSLLGVFLVLFSVLPAWAITRIVSRRREQRRELYVSANYDQLTMLPNRNLFLDRLQQSLFRSRRYRRQGALLFIDLDGFKSVNDSYGHETGDLLLKLVGRRLVENVRRSDTAARHGGDEFVVLVPEERDRAEAEHLGRKLLHALSEPYLLPGYRLEIGASIGIRVYSGEPDETPELIVRDADTAMYQAKNEGKGRLVVFSG